jgi:RNA polymerase sigma-70 factor (ECF subfamily)
VRCLAEARRWTRTAADAEDVVQEALIRGWRMRHRCRSSDEPTAWLLRITRNEALRAASRRAATEQAMETPPEPEVDVGGGAEQSLLERIEIRRALAALPPADRLLLLLRYGEDLTQPRVAEVLGIPEGTAKIRLHRLRAVLRRRLVEP